MQRTVSNHVFFFGMTVKLFIFFERDNYRSLYHNLGVIHPRELKTVPNDNCDDIDNNHFIEVSKLLAEYKNFSHWRDYESN